MRVPYGAEILILLRITGLLSFQRVRLHQQHRASLPLAMASPAALREWKSEGRSLGWHTGHRNAATQ